MHFFSSYFIIRSDTHKYGCCSLESNKKKFTTCRSLDHTLVKEMCSMYLDNCIGIYPRVVGRIKTQP